MFSKFWDKLETLLLPALLHHLHKYTKIQAKSIDTAWHHNFYCP